MSQIMKLPAKIVTDSIPLTLLKIGKGREVVHARCVRVYGRHLIQIESDVLECVKRSSLVQYVQDMLYITTK